MTGADLIARAMRIAGVLAMGETPAADEAADALLILNQMLDSWSTEKLMVFTNQRQVFNLVGGQQAYQMGSGAPDFNVTRPARIESASIISLQNPANPLEYPIDMYTDKEWQGIPVKNISGPLPAEVWDDGGFPFRILSYYPIPNIQCQTVLYTWTQLLQWGDLTVDNTFPPGYLEAITYNLALRIDAEWPGNIKPGSVSLAGDTLRRIRIANVQPSYLKCDAALSKSGGRYNVYTDGRK